MSDDAARFFIDERSGCIAIRDRTLTDPDYPGLHSDTQGVVWYRHGTREPCSCPTCGNIRYEWKVTKSDRDAAEKECDRLNGEHELNIEPATEEVLQAWGDGP